MESSFHIHLQIHPSIIQNFCVPVYDTETDFRGSSQWKLHSSFHTFSRIVPYVGGAELRMKPRPTFSVSEQLWLHSDMYFWVPFSWIQRTLRVSMGAIWNWAPLNWYQIMGYKGPI